MRPHPDPVGPGQESVWEYPRPAVAVPSTAHVRIEHCGAAVADTRSPVRVLETSQPPNWYVPPGDVDPNILLPSDRRSFCEWKGVASYWHLQVGNKLLRDVAWSYPDPTAAFHSVRDHLAFYAGSLELCTVNGERVRPQPGGFYGGWVTSDLAGPFKGASGSAGW